ncbi:cellulase family glycosylhydrolase [Bacteroidales bacterium]|nr:cellulase family glycosylhydrolase [Bacteroidales bacterium]
MKNFLYLIIFTFVCIGVKAETIDLSTVSYSSTLADNAEVDTAMRKISAMEIAADMAPGINLLNTLDAHGSWVSGLKTETCWGKPYTTFEIVKSMADRGFKTLRIPVTWKQHIGPAPGYVVDAEWMNRVETVVNYALDNGMYAIINIHHDDEHFIPTYAKQAEGENFLNKMWTQIATRFKDYGDRLIFETMNEPRVTDSPHEWTTGLPEHRDVLNDYVQVAVDAIRNTGGNNEKRFVMIQQYAASFDAAIESIVYPPGDTNLILSTHNYAPSGFCLDGKGPSKWGTASEIASLQNEIKAYGDYVDSTGIPIIIGEWGAVNKNNYVERMFYYHVFANACKSEGVTPILWMFNFDRRKLTWNSPLVEEAIIYAYDSTKIKTKSLQLDKLSDSVYVDDTVQLNATILPETASCKEILWTSSNPDVATVNASGLITAHGFGKSYIIATTIGKSSKFTIHVINPANDTTATKFHIEAEDFETSRGIRTEKCSDVNGGTNLGYIRNDYYTTYLVPVDTSAIYYFTARVATFTDGGTIEISIGDSVVGSVMVDGEKSDGWQDWYTTDTIGIALKQGMNEIKLTFKGESSLLYSVNWFELNITPPITPTLSRGAKADKTDFIAYPNPATNTLYLNYSLKSVSDVDIKVFDIHGRMVAFINEKGKLPGNYSISQNVTDLNRGIYFLNVNFNNDIVTQMIHLK